MKTIFIYTLGRFRGSILGWGIGLALLGGFLIRFYDTLATQGEEWLDLVSQLPKEMMAFFGDMSLIFTPAGYLNTEFFSYIPLILGIFIISMGSGLLVGEEEKGTLDLVLAHPISRTRLFLGRIAAYLATIASILCLTWLAFVLMTQGTKLEEVSALEMSQPLLSLAGLLIFFGAMGVLLSLVLPSQRTATMVASLVLFASFFLTALAKLNLDLQNLEFYSPYHYYQGGLALNDMNWSWLAVLLGGAALQFVAAGWCFQRRDIRVAGEAGWRLSLRRAGDD